MRARRWITNNFGLKLLSLILAIATWFYINRELTKKKDEEEKAIFSMLNYEVVSKKLPIQLTLVGKTQAGYEIATNRITLDPDTVVVIGPKNILSDVAYARTMPIDISEHIKDIVKEIPLAPIAEGISLKNYIVKVNIPIISKIEEGPNK
ncbi:MAG: YbbR-like domain-containing protein [Candidatus Omnitrophica bacterium]|nr:YbbR-like domain-containing protein [Candidatus Omnitrophota bacterium]